MSHQERPQPTRRTVAQMIVVGLIASVIGIAIGLAIHWFPPADSTQADKIDTLWDVLIIVS
ncbi:MAG: coxB, partial [Solirubrobacterales bacterium]|nr:coxB [Solirubrobacterales bacterium]